MRCVMFGYAKQQKAYRRLDTTTGKVLISRSVTFAKYAVNQPRNRDEDTPSVIDVFGDSEDNQEPSDQATSEEGSWTPVIGSPK